MPVTGAIEQPHVYPWSTVMRVPTADGSIWFKANVPVLGHEAAVVSILAARDPDRVPAPLAVDTKRGWLLMRDAGLRLREIVEREQDLARWVEILPLYGRLQIDAAGDAADLLAAGAPDRRLATLAAQYEALIARCDRLRGDRLEHLRTLVPRVGEMCRELKALGISETIQHDDFHDGQVFVHDGRYLFLDWGDACVSHPFFTMSVTLEGVLGWGLDDIEGSQDTTAFATAYLEPFNGYGTEEQLRSAFATALRLGWICRALNTEMCVSAYNLEHQGDERDRVGVLLAMFADGMP
jgi:hypothetical protein